MRIATFGVPVASDLITTTSAGLPTGATRIIARRAVRLRYP
jgi:hypothetical protein